MFFILKQLLKTMRPKQWVKNLLLYSGVVFDRHLFELRPILIATLGFIIFCGISSAVYLLNDLVDIKKDQLHPKKRFRPLASGKLPKSVAIVALVVLVVVCLPAAYFLQPTFAGIVLFYFVIQVFYSFYLKNIVIIDVFTLASGFVLRAVAGALVIQVEVSPWLLVCTMLGALFIGLAKRRHELVLLAEGASSHRQILEEYSSELVQEMISVVTSSVVIAYSLYTITYDKLPKNHLMALTIPFVLYGIFRYLYLVYKKDEGGSPEELLFKDIPLLACVVLWGLASIGILYFFPV